MKNTAAVIFSAGKGVRLRPLTEKTPKPLLEIVNGKSLLDFTLESLVDIGVKDIFINYSYAKELFDQKLLRYSSLCNITLLKEEELLGQGGTILKNISQLRKYDKVLCSNGDTYTKYNREKLLSHHDKKRSSLTILSDNKQLLPRDILTSLSGDILGCRLNNKNFFYKKSLLNLYQRNNYLGEFIINPNDIADKEYTEEYRGLFGSDDLIEILKQDGREAIVHKEQVDYFLSMNTIEEYDKVKSFCNQNTECLNILKNF